MLRPQCEHDGPKVYIFFEVSLHDISAEGGGGGGWLFGLSSTFHRLQDSIWGQDRRRAHCVIYSMN